MNHMHFHKRNLPHIYSPGYTYFITFRLKGSIPKRVLNDLRNRKEFNRDFPTKAEKYKSHKKFFLDYDKLLDNNYIGHLTNPRIARIVSESLHFYDQKEIDLFCYTIMPNHVHVVFYLLQSPKVSQTFKSENYQLERMSRIMKSIKGYSARQANKILKRKGSFWQAESYDHIVRNGKELQKIIEYVIFNPVKAGLVKRWEDWKYTYVDLW